MRRLTLFCIIAVSTVAPLSAQDSTAAGAPGRVCYHARPKPACTAFFLTNFGAYLVLGGNGGRESPLRGVVDWGVMANVSTRDAIGASVFVSLDEGAFGVGPAVRYRRWLPGSGSLEVAVGAPLVTGLEEMKAGSVFGLVKWNTSDLFAIAVRPELIRQSVLLGCGPSSCSYADQSRGRVSIGMETGGVPGVVLSTASGIAAMVLIAAVAA